MFMTGIWLQAASSINGPFRSFYSRFIQLRYTRNLKDQNIANGNSVEAKITSYKISEQEKGEEESENKWKEKIRRKLDEWRAHKGE